MAAERMNRTKAKTVNIVLRSSMFPSRDGSGVLDRSDADGLHEFKQRLFEHRQLQAIGDGSAGLDGIDQVGRAQHSEVSRQSWLRHRNPGCKLSGRHRLLPQQLQNAATGRVRERLEYQVHISMFSKI